MEEGKWVTLKGGRKVFIKNGQSLTDAINEYDNELTKKIDAAEKVYVKAKENKLSDRYAWTEAQVNEINNKNPMLNNKYHINERKAAKNYMKSANKFEDAENKLNKLRKKQESFRNAAMEAQGKVIEPDKKDYIKKTPRTSKPKKQKTSQDDGLKMTIYYNGKKVSKKKAEQLFGKQYVKDRIPEAINTFMEDPNTVIEWMDGMGVTFERR